MSEAFNGSETGSRPGEPVPEARAETEVGSSAAGEPAVREYTAPGAGVELYVKEMGKGPPVVVLHGGPGAHHDYLIPGFDRLADEFHLYFYDQRGGGRSSVDRPGQVTWRDHVADLESLRHGWGLERPAIIGYSWGGLLALLYAAEYPDKVSCLACVDPAAGWGDYQERFRAEFDARMHSNIVTQLRNELENSDLRARDPEAYRQRRFELSVAGYFKDPRDARGLTPFKVQAQAQEATWRSLAGHGDELRRKLAELEQPTLILHGRHDPIPLEWAEELRDTVGAAELIVLEESGHVPYVEEPDKTFGAIREFLRECHR